MRFQYPVSILCACLLLAACSSDKATTPSSSTADENLPKPDSAAGSVTGMPNPGTPSAIPAPADNLAIGNENPDIATEDAPDDVPALDPNLPAPPPTVTLEGHLGKPPADTMPVMPAHPPADPQQLQVQPVPTPPES